MHNFEHQSVQSTKIYDRVPVLFETVSIMAMMMRIKF